MKGDENVGRYAEKRWKLLTVQQSRTFRSAGVGE